MDLFKPLFKPKAKQPLSFVAKWLLINERETRFELATLSLGSYATTLGEYTYLVLTYAQNQHFISYYLSKLISNSGIFITFVCTVVCTGAYTNEQNY